MCSFDKILYYLTNKETAFQMIIQFLGVLLKNDWLVEIAYNLEHVTLRINSHCMVKLIIHLNKTEMNSKLSKVTFIFKIISKVFFFLGFAILV